MVFSWVTNSDQGGSYGAAVLHVQMHISKYFTTAMLCATIVLGGRSSRSFYYNIWPEPTVHLATAEQCYQCRMVDYGGPPKFCHINMADRKNIITLQKIAKDNKKTNNSPTMTGRGMKHKL